jgi:hypothetical protein
VSDLDVGKEGLLYREGYEPTEGKVVKYKAGRDAGDHLIEFVDSEDGSGNVLRQWYVVREKGTHENGTFEVN